MVLAMKNLHTPFPAYLNGVSPEPPVSKVFRKIIEDAGIPVIITIRKKNADVFPNVYIFAMIEHKIEKHE